MHRADNRQTRNLRSHGRQRTWRRDESTLISDRDGWETLGDAFVYWSGLVMADDNDDGVLFLGNVTAEWIKVCSFFLSCCLEAVFTVRGRLVTWRLLTRVPRSLSNWAVVLCLCVYWYWPVSWRRCCCCCCKGVLILGSCCHCKAGCCCRAVSWRLLSLEAPGTESLYSWL